MATSNANVLKPKPISTGGLLVAAYGSTAPTDAKTALDGAFVAFGYLGDAGLVRNPDRTTQKVKAAGGDIVAVLSTDYSETYTATLIEVLKQTTLEEVHGVGNVTVTAGTPTDGTLYEVVRNGDPLPHRAFVSDYVSGVARIRDYIPDGQITAVGAISYKDDEIMAYPVTIEAYRDASIGGNSIQWIDDGILVP